MNEMEKKSFMERYSAVFDSNDKIMACGRQKCIDLLLTLKEMYPNEDYGNLANGFLDIEKIQELRNQILAENK